MGTYDDRLSAVEKLWDDNFDSWTEASNNGYDVWRDHLNTPAFLQMLPDITGLSGLDIAFGDGFNTRLIAQRCRSMVAIDIVQRFIDHITKANPPSNVSFQKADAAKMPFDSESFDFVVSTMSFMDIADIDKVFNEAYRVLRPNGFLQFSITHPCFNTFKGNWERGKDNKIIGFLMRDYFSESEGKIHTWKHFYSPEQIKEFKVPRFCKPLYKWFDLLFNAKFMVEKVSEPVADDATINKYPALSTTKITPHSLIIRARKLEEAWPFKEIIKTLPGNVWWKNNKLIYQGCNAQVLRMLGLNSIHDFIGKTDYDLWEKDIAIELEKADRHILETGKPVTIEEIIVEKDGNKAVMLTNKSPMYDQNGAITGIVGTSTNITDRKKVGELQKHQEQAEKIRTITAQVVHDISSPLASLQVIANRKDIEEEIRTTIRGASNRINDIVNNLAVRYGTTNKEDQSAANATSPELIFCLIDSILSEKRVQYMGCNISFNLDVTDNARGLFAKVNAEKFKRLLSNIINNSVEAIVKAEPKQGHVDVSLQKYPHTLNIQIKDNGCGIPTAILNKIGLNKISTKEEKNHGIGLYTAITQLKEWGCKYQINSQANIGTIFSIDMPLCKTPNWFQKKLVITPKSKIVVLDDDQSIHDVWDSRFKELNRAITIKHFHNPDKLLKHRLQSEDVLYLIDYELLGAECTGIDLIKKLKLKDQSILVTSRYEDKNIKADCKKLQLKIIPKNFAPYIPLRIKED